MILRFEVNQAEAFRRGVNVRNSTNHLEVNPAELPQDVRNLIADRLDGIDVCELDEDGSKGKMLDPDSDGRREEWIPRRITANSPDFDALMEAIYKNQEKVKCAAAAAAA